MIKRLYCDYNATTPVLDFVKKKYKEGLDSFGNASSLYQRGREAKEILESTRDVLASILSCQSDQLIFTSSGTESNNHVLKSLIFDKVVLKKSVHVLVSAIEHSSVLNTVLVLNQFGIDYDLIPVCSDGKIDKKIYQSLFREDTRLVSIMMANNEMGAIQDISWLCQIAHDKGALFHTDAVQAFGKITINISELDIDFLSISAHKVYAPKGVGVLFVKDDHYVNPLIDGAHHERHMRASTENIPGIYAFKAALSVLDIDVYQAHTYALKHYFVDTLSKNFDKLTFHQPKDGLSNTVSVSFEGVSGHHLAMNCDLEGIDVSTGSACSVGAIEPSHVLRAMGVADDLNQSTLRFSFGLMTTQDDLLDLVNRLHTIVTRMRV